MNILEGTERVIQSNVLLFGKYEMTGIGIKDGGLAKYIDLTGSPFRIQAGSMPIGHSQSLR